jgi:glycerophosphoryl diester phosphodiesterase
LIVAHRGDVASAPENTILAFESAIAKGAGAIEFDVHSTRDEKLVVHHDTYLGRTERASGYIGDCTLAELQALDVGEWFDSRFTGMRMPTLDQVLALGNESVRFEIELRTPTVSFLKAVVRIVASANLERRVELTSPHLPLLWHAKGIEPRLCTGLFLGPFEEWMKPALRRRQIVDWLHLSDALVAHLSISNIDSELIGSAHEDGMLIHGADLNTERDIEAAVELNVDQFSTDRLDLALAICRRPR